MEVSGIEFERGWEVVLFAILLIAVAPLGLAFIVDFILSKGEKRLRRRC